MNKNGMLIDRLLKDTNGELQAQLSGVYAQGAEFHHVVDVINDVTGPYILYGVE